MEQQLQPACLSSGVISLLVVEDDRTVRTLLGMIIARKFPDVVIHMAEDGRAGLELYKEHAPQIVVTDISMPVMDGLQMSREIRLLGAAAKIIVVTAYDNSDCFDTFHQIGVEGFIVKPIAFEKLFSAIETCLAEVAAANE
jgi:YesN/AraC family two-component response regulator